MSEDTTQLDTDTDDGQETQQPEKDWAAEAEKWKALARRHEGNAKANATKAKEFDALLEASKTDQERAVEQAREEAAAAARADERSRFGSRLVDAEIRAVAAGRLEPDQVSVLMEGLDRSRFLTDDGDVDTKKVTKLLDGLVPTKKTYPDLGQGRRGTAPKPVDMNQAIRQAAGLA